MFCLFINYAHLLTQARFLIRPLGIVCVITDTLYINPRGRKKKLTRDQVVYIETAGNLCASRAEQKMFHVYYFCFCVGEYNKTLKRTIGNCFLYYCYVAFWDRVFKARH